MCYFFLSAARSSRECDARNPRAVHMQQPEGVKRRRRGYDMQMSPTWRSNVRRRVAAPYEHLRVYK